MQEKQNRKENITKKDNKILKVMKLYLAITLLFVLSISAENSFSQTKSISVDLNGITLKQAFNEIENSSDYLFIIIDNAYSELNRRVDADFHDKSINEILDIILDKTDLVYTVVNRQVTISREKGMEKNRVPEAEAHRAYPYCIQTGEYQRGWECFDAVKPIFTAQEWKRKALTQEQLKQ
jgi:hypothetical protein